MPHRSLLVSVAGGVLCLPATFWSSRNGSLVLSLGIVVAIAGAASLLGASNLRPTVRLAAFALGAAVAEGVLYMYYFVSFGNDPVGTAVAIVEFLGIAITGAITLLLIPFVRRRSGASAA